MIRKKSSDRYLAQTLMLTWTLINLANPTGLQAQTQQVRLSNLISQRPKEKLIYNQPPKDPGAPGNQTSGTGDRGNCTKESIAALIPRTNIGFTIADRPTFWFYIPYQPGVTAEFTLRDENNRVVYTTKTFQLTNTPGIISISLPATVAPLDIGSIETGKKRYRWFFSAICNPERRDEDLTVRGYVQRITLPGQVMNQIKQATGRDRLLLYAKNGLWYDAITDLSEMRRRQPQDPEIAVDWADLIANEKVQLKELISTPIVSCCTPR